MKFYIFALQCVVISLVLVNLLCIYPGPQHDCNDCNTDAFKFEKFLSWEG